MTEGVPIAITETGPNQREVLGGMYLSGGDNFWALFRALEIIGQDGVDTCALETWAGARTPTINVVTCAAADTEYSWALPDNVKALEIHAREPGVLVRIAFATGEVNDPAAGIYFSIPAGGIYYKDQLWLEDETLYISADTTGAKVEILAWS